MSRRVAERHVLLPMRRLTRLRSRIRRPAPDMEATAPASCPACGQAVDARAPVCTRCGLPTARSGDPLRGVAPRWSATPDTYRSGSTSLVGLMVVLVTLFIGGILATSGGGVLNHGGRLGLAPPPTPSSSAGTLAEQSTGSPSITSTMSQPRIELAEAVEPVEPVGEASEFTCEDFEIRAALSSRWQIEAVRAGARRGFERVTFQLGRRGKARRPARVTFRWMSPAEARQTFGLPKFRGQHGLLLTFRGPARTGETSLIGSTDLVSQDMKSVSGIYRFTDVEGTPRTFVALRDEACARISAPKFETTGGGSGSPRIILDLRRP